MSVTSVHDLFTEISAKIDKLQPRDTFYLAMALGRGLQRKFHAQSVPNYSDLVFSVYLAAAANINEFDLYQLGQLSMFLASEDATAFVPDDFWSVNLEPALEDSLVSYLKFKDQLSAEAFWNDFARCLVSFGLRGSVSPLFKGKVEHVMALGELG